MLANENWIILVSIGNSSLSVIGVGTDPPPLIFIFFNKDTPPSPF